MNHLTLARAISCGRVAAFLLVCLPLTATAATWHLNPEGTGDAPTIREAYDLAAPGDVIELACGTYHESHSFATQIYPRAGVTLRSESGDPACAVIDAQDSLDLGSVFYVDGQDDVRFEGLTVTGGHASDVFLSSTGGGFRIQASHGIVIERCLITGNIGRFGGGLAIIGSDVTMLGCTVTDNLGLGAGGGLAVTGTLHALDCDLTGNTSPDGADGAVGENTTVTLTCCRVWPAFWSIDGSLVLENEGCTVPDAPTSWGSLKADYR